MIFVVRHGQTDWNLEKRNQGRTDIELNQTGIKQAEMLRDKLKDVNFDKVFSSPLKRAYKTAQIICDNDIIVDERLIERGNGELEGKLRAEYDGLVDFNDYEEKRFGIEELSSVRNRIADFFDEILKDYHNENILVVTHAGVSIYIKCYFEGEPMDGDYNKYKLDNCEIFKVE